MSNKEILTILKERMNSFMPKDAEVMLFGSRARGYYSDASDWDLLVLLDRPGRISVAELGRISYPFYDLGAELDIEINPVIYTKEDWQYRKHTPFYANATTDTSAYGDNRTLKTGSAIRAITMISLTTVKATSLH